MCVSLDSCLLSALQADRPNFLLSRQPARHAGDFRVPLRRELISSQNTLKAVSQLLSGELNHIPLTQNCVRQVSFLAFLNLPSLTRINATGRNNRQLQVKSIAPVCNADSFPLALR